MYIVITEKRYQKSVRKLDSDDYQLMENQNTEQPIQSSVYRLNPSFFSHLPF